MVTSKPMCLSPYSVFLIQIKVQADKPSKQNKEYTQSYVIVHYV